MRFLIAPNHAMPYDQRMVRGLALALRQAGHAAQPLSAPVEDFVLPQVCQAFDADVVLRVNRFRPLEDRLPAKVRHIAWFQDVFPETLADVHARIEDKDIVYVLGDPQALGFNVELPCYVGTLLTGIDETIRTKGADGDLIDFSLCGYIPRPLIVSPNVKGDLAWLALPLLAPVDRIGFPFSTLLGRFRKIIPYAMAAGLVGLVEAIYEPLRGNLDIHQLTATMNEFVASHFGYRPRPSSARTGARRPKRGSFANVMAPYRVYESGRGRRGAMEHFTSYLAREYPRLLDRVLFINEMLSVSTSLELYGPGWSEHPDFQPYHKGILNSAAELAQVFCRSRINLANNTHGLGLHSRTLDCMAVGGFIFTHASPADAKPGGMHTAFEPGVHYGMFTPETMTDEARRWLRDEERRRKAGADAAAIVRAHHTWHQRAEQILADLRNH